MTDTAQTALKSVVNVLKDMIPHLNTGDFEMECLLDRLNDAVNEMENGDKQ